MNQRSTLEQRACHGLTFARAPHTVLLVVLSSQRRRGRSVTVANVPAAIRRGELRVRRVASIRWACVLLLDEVSTTTENADDSTTTPDRHRYGRFVGHRIRACFLLCGPRL